MILALGSRQHLFDVVETANPAGTQIEPYRPKGLTWPAAGGGRIEARAQQGVHRVAKRRAPTALFFVQSNRHVIVQRQRRAHVVMLIR